MQVSTKLFNQQSVNQFGKLTEEIQDLQAKVATGKNILKSSDDPVAAVELSAAKEQKKNPSSTQQFLCLLNFIFVSSLIFVIEIELRLISKLN